MAVVTTVGGGYADPVSYKSVSAFLAQTHSWCIVSPVAVVNGDSINSVYKIGRIPSDAIIDPASTVVADAIAGLTNMQVGIAQVAAAGAATANALANGVDWHAGGSFALAPALTAAQLATRAWQLAGLTADPGGFLDVFAVLKAAAGAGGNLTFFLRYFKP